MNENFNYQFNEIEKLFFHNHILCIEQVFPLLTMKDTHGLNIILISEKKGITTAGPEILPSMSVYKNKQENPDVASSYSDIWEYLKKFDGENHRDIEKTRLLEDIINYASKCGFSKFLFKEYKITILIPKKEYQISSIKENCLNNLAKTLFLIRQKSLNLLNDSNQLADEDRKSLTLMFEEEEKPVIDIVNEFITDRYDINAYPMHYSSRTKGWECSRSCPIKLQKLVKNNIKKVEDKAMPIAGVDDKEYFVIFPFISMLKMRDLNDLIVIISNDPIPAYIVTNLRYIVNYYFAIYLEEKKSDLLEELQIKSLRLHRDIEYEINNGKPLNINKKLTEYIQPAFSTILETTNVFSSTYRSYDPVTKALVKIAESSSPRVESNERLTDDIIPIDCSYKSQVAYTFIKSTPADEGKYRPNINSSVENLPYREHRKNSNSELSFCVFFKSVPIGVLNFESPIVKGLSDDRRFLKKIRTSLESYVTILYESNDKNWLARRSRVYQNLHEIKNIIGSKSFPTTYASEIDKYIELNETVDRSIDMVNIIELSNFRDQYLDSYFEELKQTVPMKSIRNEMFKEFSKGCNVGLVNTNLSIESYKMNLLKILYKNLLDNYKKWSKRESDSVNLNSIHKKNSIEFYVKSSRLYDTSILGKLLSEPFTTLDGSVPKSHYGMFIIGMISRHLGGYAYAVNNQNLDGSSINIIIPINKK